MHAYITIDDVRTAIQDNSPEDNGIDCDLSFSDEEIMHAMERAAAAYNSMAPIGVDRVSAKCLPLHSEVFLNAVLSKLYNAATFKLARNLVGWKTGNTSVEFESTRMEAYKSLVKELEEMWRTAAKERKAEINRAQCWGSF